MTTTLHRPATSDSLFLWVMHRFAEEFEDHAILKGGLALRLLDSPRHTTDIDYVFVPFTSKNDIHVRIKEVLDEIEGAIVQVAVHSKMIRAELRVDDAAIQIEADVATECESLPMATGGFARQFGHPSRVVRIMSLSYALANKVAAWNERRLLRDLYDCYFLSSRAGAEMSLEVLDGRLGRIESRLPKMKKVRKMTRAELSRELREATSNLTDDRLQDELGGLLPSGECAGLAIRITTAVRKLAEVLEGSVNQTV